MAILVNDNSQARPKGKLITVIVVVVLLGLGVYYLFFAPTPFIEVVAPDQLRPITNISKIQLDPSKILNSPIYQSLREQVPAPAAGSAGRPNPFQPY